MKIYDISMNIHSGMMVYKNNPNKKPKITVKSDYSNSHLYETNISIDSHTGTHIDAPLHMIEGGSTIETYPLENFITECKVFDFTNLTDRITANDLSTKNINQGDFILFKTKNSFSEEFSSDFIFVDKTAATYLADKNIIGVGIDSLGIERNQANHETHITLLSKGIIILEGLRLKEVSEGNYNLIALPLKIDNVEATVTRAVLIENN